MEDGDPVERLAVAGRWSQPRLPADDEVGGGGKAGGGGIAVHRVHHLEVELVREAPRQLDRLEKDAGSDFVLGFELRC